MKKEYIEIDLADETQIHAMVDWILRIYGVPDVIFNNATIVKIGAVDQVETAIWDKSYAVNFKAPLILTQLFLQHMKERKSGTIVFVSSSGAAPYLGAYEVFKTAQVELSNTLAMELEGSDVFVYTIGPGLVKTETAMRSIEIVANNMGMTTDEFYNMNNHNTLDVEKAGLGFALSAAFSERYHGQEISCNQVLIEFKGLSDYQEESEPSFETSSDVQKNRERRLASIQETFCKQHAAWQKLNVFERQWLFRDFKKNMGMSAEQADGIFVQLQQKIEQRQRFDLKDRMFFSNLQKYWEHQLKLLRGYEKDESKLKEKEKFITNWINDICEFLTDWPCN